MAVEVVLWAFVAISVVTLGPATRNLLRTRERRSAPPWWESLRRWREGRATGGALIVLGLGALFDHLATSRLSWPGAFVGSVASCEVLGVVFVRLFYRRQDPEVPILREQVVTLSAALEREQAICLAQAQALAGGGGGGGSDRVEQLGPDDQDGGGASR